MNPAPARFARVLVRVAVAVLACLAAGCSWDSSVRVQSVQGNVKDEPVMPVSAYRAIDASTADIFLTNLDAMALDRGTDLSRVSGRITQFHMFLTPVAGATPIESSACSVTIRHIVLAEGAIGVYSGGGFLMPRGRPGDSSLGGTLQKATLRLTGRTPTFTDPLGPCTMDARILAPRDEALAKRIGARVEDVLAAVRIEPRP